MTLHELKATTVLAMDLDECVAIRVGMPIDDEEDYALPTWARRAAGPDASAGARPRNLLGLSAPDFVARVSIT